MPQIIFLNRYFYPDHSATSQILSDLAFHLASTGLDISVVTGRQRYDDPAAELPLFEDIKNVRVHRIATTRFGRNGILGRSTDYASFYASALRKVTEISGSGDVLVTKTDPPLLSILGSFVQKSKKLTFINWLQDLYPEVAHELGIPFMAGPIYWTLMEARNRSLRRAGANAVIGAMMADRVEAAGVARSRIHIIPNWVNEHEIAPVPRGSNPLVHQWGLAEKFVVGYSGNLGRAHEFETVLQAAELLKSEPSIVFLIVGSGSGVLELKARSSAMGLARSFSFQPYQPEHLLHYSLGVPHIHWISLLPQLEGLIVPSKFYGIAAAGRPTLLIGSEHGELGQIIRRDGIGYVIHPGNAPELAMVVLSIKHNQTLLSDLGQRARHVSETQFARHKALSAWSTLLDSVINARS